MKTMIFKFYDCLENTKIYYLYLSCSSFEVLYNRMLYDAYYCVRSVMRLMMLLCVVLLVTYSFMVTHSQSSPIRNTDSKL